MSDIMSGLIAEQAQITRRVQRLEIAEASPSWVRLTTPLTSTSWDGDSFSTTAKTVIDLSAVFAVPANVKAVYVRMGARDAGTAPVTAYIGLAPNDTAYSFMVICRPSGDDIIVDECAICWCNSDGDIYYQCAASGSGTLDVWLEIWGYLI